MVMFMKADKASEKRQHKVNATTKIVRHFSIDSIIYSQSQNQWRKSNKISMPINAQNLC